MYDHNLKSLKEYVENKEVWQMAVMVMEWWKDNKDE